MLDKAFETLQTYDWGDDRNVLDPIDEAIVATQGDKAGRQDLEDRMIAVLKGDGTRNGKDFVCRKLKVMGTTASVPVLAAMLSHENHSHMARYALESMPNSDAGKALLASLPQLTGKLKVGVIGSLGVRQDNDSVPALASLLGDDDSVVANAAAHALGAVRTSDAAQALAVAKANPSASQAVVNASLACAESLLASDDRIGALAIYKRLAKGDPAQHIKLAATRGMLACASK